MIRWPGSAKCLGAAAVLLLACGSSEPAAPPPTPVTVLSLKQAAAPPGGRFAGKIVPATTVQVRSQADGVVEKIQRLPGADGTPREIQSGDVVKRGAFLVQIERDVYEERLGEAEAQLASARARFADQSATWTRAQALFEAEVISQQQLDNERAAYESSKAEVARNVHAVGEAKIKLDRTRVESPLDGLVLSREVEEGDVVRQQTRLFEIGDVSSVEVVFGAPAALAAKLGAGELLHLTVASLPERSFAGRITRIDAAADARSGLFDVELSLPDPGGDLKPGLVAEVQIPRGLLQAAQTPQLLPLDAIVRPPQEPDAFAVYVVASTDAGDVARLKRVQVGNPVGSRVAVNGGLDGDERVIVRGSTLVHDGSPVRVIP